MSFCGGGPAVQHDYCSNFLLTVSHNGNPVIHINKDKIHEKNMNKVLKSKC